jgi:hypothetical protein
MFCRLIILMSWRSAVAMFASRLIDEVTEATDATSATGESRCGLWK